MPLPTSSDVHVNVPLTNVSVAYMQAAENFIAPWVFPIVPVANQSDIIVQYNRADWLRNAAAVRSGAVESAGGGFRIASDATYFAKVWAYHFDVADQTRRNQTGPIDLDKDGANFVAQKMLMAMDAAFASAYMTTGVWGSDATGGSTFTKWSTVGSTPIADVRVQARTLQQRTGFKPNVLVLGKLTYDVLVDHADIISRISGGSANPNPALVNKELLARLFEVKKVLVCESVYTTSQEGASTVTTDFAVDPDGALLVYAAPTPSLLMPSGGYTFVWNGYSAVGATNQFGIATSRFRLEKLKADRIEAEAPFDTKLVESACGIYFDDCVD